MAKNSIKIFDSSFTNQILSINKDKDYTDYCLFGKKGLVIMKNWIIYVNRFENNSIIKEREILLQLYGTNRPLIGTNEYIILGDVGQNNFNNFKIKQSFLCQKFATIYISINKLWTNYSNNFRRKKRKNS